MKYLKFTDQLNQYVTNHNNKDSDLQTELREVTPIETGLGMMISPDQAQFMRTLITAIQPSKILEVGVFTGYSSLVMAQTMLPTAHITACDISEEWTNIARRYWEKAGVTEKITLHIGPANDSLNVLLSNEEGPFDLAFIDADKVSYDDYYEKALLLIKTGGVILIDNVLWKGTVANPERNDEDISALRLLNDKLATDSRVISTILPIGDGMLMITKH